MVPRTIYSDTEYLYRGGLAMDVNIFCGSMQTEINSLKARVYDIMQEVEKTKGKVKKNQSSQLKELYALIEHLTEMNNKLSRACPLDWSAEKKAIEAKKSELVEKIDIWDSEHLAGLVDN
jgi:DNA anti-recombination protein RmuC